jgi:hypothetical protein
VKGLDAPITKDGQSSDRLRRHNSRICYGIPEADHSNGTCAQIAPVLHNVHQNLLIHAFPPEGIRKMSKILKWLKMA